MLLKKQQSYLAPNEQLLKTNGYCLGLEQKSLKPY